MTKRALYLLLLLPAGLRAAPVASCGAEDKEIITVQGNCLDTGLSVGYRTEGATAACLENNALRAACGNDGELARTHAFAAWLDKIKTFEGRCAARGGTFGYEDKTFEEPQDESFCKPAEPFSAPSMFEDTLCNYRSQCPPTPVVCEHPCHGHL